jgi:hypothetical protein
VVSVGRGDFAHCAGGNFLKKVSPRAPFQKLSTPLKKFPSFGGVPPTAAGVVAVPKAIRFAAKYDADALRAESRYMLKVFERGAGKTRSGHFLLQKVFPAQKAPPPKKQKLK